MNVFVTMSQRLCASPIVQLSVFKSTTCDVESSTAHFPYGEKFEKKNLSVIFDSLN